MATVFICDRRTYTMTFTARIASALEERLGAGSVVDDTAQPSAAGDEAGDALGETLRQCAAMLVVIGRDWLESRTPEGARRLDDATDPVRVEIETALRLGMPVIPVLADGATLPTAADLPESLQPLARAPALSVRHGIEFKRDVEQIVVAVEGAMAIRAAAHAREQRNAAATAAAATPTPRVVGLSPVPTVRRKRTGLAAIPRPLLVAVASVVVLAVCAVLVFSGALHPSGPRPGQPGSGISPAQATQTSIVEVTQTVLASPTLPYFAAAPGPKCDRGYFPWQSRVGGISYHGTITCAADHTHVTGTAGCPTCGDGGFSYTIGSALALPDPFTVSVQVSNLGTGTNAFLEVSLDALNNNGVEVLELDSPNTAYAYASLFDRGKVPVGTYTPTSKDTHTLSITVHGSSATFVLDGHTIGTRTEPAPMHVLIIDMVMQTQNSRAGGAVDFSNFSIQK